MRKTVVGVILAILVVASLGAGYLVGSGGRTSTVTVTSVRTSTVTQANSTVSLGPPYPATSLETFNVTLGGQLGVIGVDENLGRIYVGSASSDNLSVLDEYSHAVVATIQLPGVAQVVTAYFGTHMGLRGRRGRRGGDQRDHRPGRRGASCGDGDLRLRLV